MGTNKYVLNGTEYREKSLGYFFVVRWNIFFKGNHDFEVKVNREYFFLPCPFVVKLKRTLVIEGHEVRRNKIWKGLSRLHCLITLLYGERNWGTERCTGIWDIPPCFSSLHVMLKCAFYAVCWAMCISGRAFLIML